MGLFDSFLKGKKGQDSGNIFMQDPEALKQMEARQRAANDPRLASALANYSRNGGDILGQLEGMGFNEPGALSQAMQVAATDSVSGSRFATDQVQNNAILGGLFGKDGTMNRTIDEEKNLASRGYSLQPEDYEAYGQASGDIARQFGEQEASLAQALAARGLSTSGSANTAFANSQGNKLERLGAMQRQIANDRMKMNMERLGQTRQFLSQLGGQAQNAIQDQFGRQMGGRQQTQAELKQSFDSRSQQQQLAQAQADKNMQQRMATESGPGWQKLAGAGLQIGGAAAGGAFGGPMGAQMGGAMGGGLSDSLGWGSGSATQGMAMGSSMGPYMQQSPGQAAPAQPKPNMAGAPSKNYGSMA
jgi:hypothetical protein